MGIDACRFSLGGLEDGDGFLCLCKKGVHCVHGCAYAVGCGGLNEPVLLISTLKYFGIEARSASCLIGSVNVFLCS